MQTQIRGTSNFNGESDEVIAAMDRSRNLLVAAGQPEYLETRRRGDGYTVEISTPSEALASLATTLCHLELYNNGSRLAVVSDLHLYRLLGTAVGVGEHIWAQISTAKAIPTLTAMTLFSMSGKASVVPTATSEMVTGVDTTVIANGWRAYGPGAAYLAAATPGTGFNVPINGKLIIPPGCSLCLTCAASVNTASAFHIGATFDWVTAEVES